MSSRKVTPDMKVAEVIRQSPESFEILRGYGCPDMRKGFFAFMATIMPVKLAARIHRIPLNALLEKLNAPRQH